MNRAILRVLVVAAAAAYLGSLLWVYANVISPQFAYSGLVDRPAPDGSLVLAMILGVVPSVWLPVAVSRPSQVLLWMLYVLMYVPSILFPYLVLGTGFAGVFPLTVAIAVSFAVLSLMQGFRIGSLGTPFTSMRGFENLVLALTVLFGAYTILAVGIRLDLPNLADVYDVRATANQAVANSGAPFIAYTLDWSLYVVYPYAMLLGLRSRRYAMFALALGMEVLGYGVTGLKSALLLVAIVVPLYALLARRRRNVFGVSLAVAPIGVIVGSFAWDQLIGSGLAVSLLVRRTIVIPGQLLAYYYDFFSQNATYGLSQSIFKSFGSGPYDMTPPYLIGTVYFGSPSYDANANVWADGLANYGITGLFVVTVLLGLILQVLDGAGSGRDLRVTGAMAGLMAIPLSNSALFTTILSHGFGLALVLILLMPRQVEEPDVGPGVLAADRLRYAAPWFPGRD